MLYERLVLEEFATKKVGLEALRGREIVWALLILPPWFSSVLRGQGSNPGDYIPQSANATVPRLIKFGGVVKDETGKVKTGAVSLTFSLYELQEGGPPLWAESENVQVDEKGRYTVLLGATPAEGLPLDLFTSGKALWLGVQPQLAGAVEQARILLVAVPYALKASDSDTLGGKPASAYVLAGSATVMAATVGAATSSSPPSTVLQGSQAVWRPTVWRSWRQRYHRW